MRIVLSSIPSVSNFAQFCQALVPSDKRFGFQRVTPASHARPTCASYFSDASVANFYRSECQSSPFLRLSSQWFGRSRCGRDNLSSTPCGVILFFLAAIERQWRETRMASRMLSGCDTITPCAHACLQALVDQFARFRYRRRQYRRDRRRCAAFLGYSTPRRQAAQQRRSLLIWRHRYRKHAFMRNVLCERSLQDLWR